MNHIQWELIENGQQLNTWAIRCKILANILDTPHQDSRNMIHELMETVQLAENLSWAIARGAFAVSMYKLEDKTLT